MKFWQINTVVRLCLGDVVYMRRDLLHKVLEWEGQHHFMVYLTHEALWKHLDVPEGSSTVAS